mmetsp:Transcript_41340/g.104236  ORF Transcript_41340/g.104236 Transcript_41340/m.104236 type:complete len:285 (-) Transcript_41340:122-976(-)|eukprot:CAMPEP_0177653450 /NCGR_PEP_ID=MMETSP0447-20121125/13741_1 /TAXON_ID=0 /ORGANISM="Stygamoeba regulata, Strain BSH-02190019" /LENGTH=284 /DNA_ID=CAMNT_0019156905 /DNA_START=242 /DNA_END=1096 /DNA_ORIENTATION=-
MNHRAPIVLLLILSFSVATVLCDQQKHHGTPPPPSKPILVIGASYSNGKVNFNLGLTSPLFGVAIGAGSWLSLGDALVRDRQTDGFVVNEAQAGATTFDRLGCNPGPECGPGMWDSYETQFFRALARVTVPDPEAEAGVSYNADYVVITIANDCLHSDAFGVPQTETTPCTQQEVEEAMDRMIAVGQLAVDRGITPIYTIYPDYANLQLSVTQAAFGLAWIANEQQYNALRDTHRERIAALLPDALLVDAYRRFEASADGLHPTSRTHELAAIEVLRAMRSHQH